MIFMRGGNHSSGIFAQSFDHTHVNRPVIRQDSERSMEKIQQINVPCCVLEGKRIEKVVDDVMVAAHGWLHSHYNATSLGLVK